MASQEKAKTGDIHSEGDLFIYINVGSLNICLYSQGDFYLEGPLAQV